MDKFELIGYWLETSKHDYDSCFELFQQTQRYDWALFIAHLSLEKLLKAAWIKNNENNNPPLIHNLLKLSNSAGLIITEEQKTILSEFNDFNIETRCPDIKLNFYRLCTKEFTGNKLEQLKEIYQCILAMI